MMCAEKRHICAPGSSSIDPTPREADIAELLSMGYGYKQIARTLEINVNTVGRHVWELAGKIPGHGPPKLKVAVWWLTKYDDCG
jgi:DNA-binding NarL/FixJ family response regulator